MKEIIFSEQKLPTIQQEVLKLGKGSNFFIIRNGYPILNEAAWKQFLIQNCDLTLDERQYNLNEKLELTDWWEISYQPDKAISYAYSKTRQPLHSDNSWFSDPAEINFFIMKKQAKSGGEQSIYELDRLIDDLASKEKSLLDDLCNVEVVIKKGDGEYFNKTSIIKAGHDPKIFWNFYRTEKPTKLVEDMCNKFFAFLQKQEETSSVEFVKSETGDCFCFHDLKLLHGRQAFEATEPYERILLQSMWKMKGN